MAVDDIPQAGQIYTVIPDGHRPMEYRGNGARGRSRTADTAIFSRMLYQLSYPGTGDGEDHLSFGEACL